MSANAESPGPLAGIGRWLRLSRARRRRAAFCTIATQGFLAGALVLFDALRRWHPGARRVLLYVGGEAEVGRVPVLEGIEVTTPAELVGAETESLLRRRYSVAEFCFALKPSLLRHLLDQGAERAVYLDSDIDVVGPLEEALAALEGADVVLTPHLDQPLPVDGKWPTDATMLRAGSCNAGFVALADSAQSRRVLEWWSERVMKWGFVAPWSGYQGDQKWLDLAPALFPGVAFLRDPGSNVAYWNLHSRRIEARDGRITANGLPVSFIHFSGFDPDNPGLLSKFQNRLREGDLPAVMARAADFARRIVAARERAAALEWKTSPVAAGPAAAGATWSAAPLPDTAYRATIVPTLLSGAVETCEEMLLNVVVTNSSPDPWPVARGPSGEGGLALTWHVRDGERNVHRWDNRRYFLPRDLAPGESIAMEIGAQAPDRPGRYFLELDLVHEGIGWFGDRGTATAWLEVHVGAFFESTA